MSKIRVMPETLANMIAAGEVVERPASVVKELLENSLDAGATKIDIEVEAGGKKLIRVVDNGEGMSRDDAITAFERHATSKLKSQDDLESIHTLGFRGEALPSIAAVSHLYLRTSTQDRPEGVEVEFKGGKLIAVRDIAWPGGAEIEVKDLFFNIPARRKFFKSDATEGVHITNLVQHYALAHPEIAFMLIKDGREVIGVAPAGSLKERAYQVLGGELLDKLNEVSFEGAGVQVSGFASNPQEQRSSRDNQFFFVNKRFVRDQLIGRALTEAYRSMMPSGTHPAVVLFIDVAAADVDVNVHPAKTEVRFLQEGAVLGAVRSAITVALQSSQPITRLPGVGRRAPDIWEQQQPTAYKEALAQPTRLNALSSETTSGNTGQVAKAAPDDFKLTSADEGEVDIQQALGLAFSIRETQAAPESTASQAAASDAQRQAFGPPAAGDFTFGAALSNSGELVRNDECAAGGFDPSAQAVQSLPGLGHGIKPLGQIRDSYVVATDEEGLLLIDQHVAHERILFEQFRDHRLRRPVEAQPTLVPQSIDLTPAEVESFAAIQRPLEEMGIEVMQLSGRTIAITSAPAGLPSADAIAVVRDVLAAADRERRSFTLEHIREEIAASMACKSAIKVNMPLTPEKMQWLIDELMKTANPMTCPHGRPIMMRFGLREIERGFKRPV